MQPDWPAPASITALMSTRQGGTSHSPFDSLNLRPPALGPDPAGAADATAAVLANQQRFALALGATPVWLHQVHGAHVVRLLPGHGQPGAALPQADASISTTPGLACAVLVADCLPVLFCTVDGAAVGAAHAGWRGLAAGVLDNTVAALCQAAACQPGQVLAWLGPCIGPQAFEVGADVLHAFGAGPLVDAGPPGAATAPADPLFHPSPRADGSLRWRADLLGLARRRLQALGVGQVSGGGWCTVADASRFFSFRRDGRTGRLAAAIAIRA